MVTLDDSKELLLYKRPFILPIDFENRRKGSTIVLLTPDYESTKRCMTAPYTINRKTFESYYMEKSVYRYISQQEATEVESPGEYIIEAALTSKEKNEMKDSDFGIPETRQYPMPDEKHVLLAIRFFNHVEEKYESTLAKNIIKKVKHFNMADKVHVGEKNRFKSYWDRSKLSSNNESVIESYDLFENLYESEQAYIDYKKMDSNLKFSGYKKDVEKASKYINPKVLKKAFDILEERFPAHIINVVISNESAVDEELITRDTVTFYTPEAMKKAGYGNDYAKYVAYISQIYAIKYINPRIFSIIYYPMAVGISGIADKELASNDRAYAHEKVYKYVLDTYGADKIKNIISSNDYLAVSRYRKEMNNRFNLIESIDPYPDEFYEIIKEDEESISTAASAPSMALEDPIPESIKKIQRMATSLKRKMRAASVYRLNKIKRDVFRVNTGTEGRGKVTGLDHLRDVMGANTAAPAPTSEALEKMTNGDYIIEGNTMYLFEDNTNYDLYLRRTLYADRIKNNKELFAIYKKVKSEMPFIKYTWPDIPKYGGKNLFFDLSFYNELFYRNYAMNVENKMNTDRMKNTYLELMSRLLKENRLNDYKKKTFFIPVLDWHHRNSQRMWMYKEDINPVSIIYDLLRKGDLNSLKKLFGKSDVIFMGSHNYFKANFSTDTFTKSANLQKFMLLIKRLIALGENGIDKDPEGELEDSPAGIAFDLIDKIEKAKGVEINNVSKFKNLAVTSTIDSNKIEAEPSTVTAVKKEVIKAGEPTKSTNKNVIKVTADENKKSIKPKNISVDRAVNAPDVNDTANAVVDAVAKAASTSVDADDALTKLDTDSFKTMIEELGNGSEDRVKIDASRASKMNAIDDEFHKKEINGKSIKELLEEDPNEKDLKQTNLKVASINDEWNHMTFMNFDKDYDPDSDIVKMLESMKDWTYPVVVRNIETKDNSTSEDVVTLWKIECEDHKGTKFTLRVDVPRFIGKSNFLKLRGNEKVLMIQSTLIPIIKTSDWECQVIGTGGYNKIFMRRVGDARGKSMPSTSRLLKSVNKYAQMYNDIKVEYGENKVICEKYNLPIDYIDMSSNINMIKYGKYKFMFNQDEIRLNYQIDDSKGLPIGVETVNGTDKIIYYTPEVAKKYNTVALYITSMLLENKKFAELYDSIVVSNGRFAYSQAGILNVKMPCVLVCAYLEGLVSTMNKAHINYTFKEKLTQEDKRNDSIDYIKFSDGYLVYDVNYSSSLLMNGFKENDTENYSIREINKKQMYREFLDNYGGSIKADGLENSYDCMVDPIMKEILEYYKLPTDYVGVLIHANNLLADNKFIPHISQNGRRWRRKELIAGYFYKALTTAYQEYANSMRHNRKASKMTMKQSAIIDLILGGDPAVSDLSINNVINDLECTNTVTNKGVAGMNVERAYTLNTRGYDESMLNIFGMDTGFSGNVGINRQASMDANVTTGRGLLKTIDGDPEKLNAAKSLTVTEALTPFGSTHDDPQRTLMTYVQTSKHMVRCLNGDPLLVTNGSDEALIHMISDIFAFKAKMDGTIVELVQEGEGKSNYMVIEYKDKSHDYVDLSEQIKKNSDGGYSVPLKLSTDLTVGAKVKGGDVVAYDKLSFTNKAGESGNLATTVGTLAKVAIMNTDDGYEDSAAITESFGKKLCTEVIMSVDAVIHKGSNIVLEKKIGDHVMEGDTLLTYQADFDDDVMNALLKNLATDAGAISELGKNPIKSKYTGTLSGIEIFRTCELDDMSESLREFVNTYERKINKTRSVYKKYGMDDATLPAVGKVPEIGKAKNVDDAVKVIFYIKYIENMSFGDKITFYSANKGIVKYIIPEGEEPYTEFRPDEKIDSFMSLGSVSARMTASIPLFAAASKLMVELDRSVKDLAGIPYDPNL